MNTPFLSSMIASWYIAHFINTLAYASSKGQYDITIYIYKMNNVECSKPEMWFAKRIIFERQIHRSYVICMHNGVIILSVRCTWKQLFLSTPTRIGNVIVVISGNFRKTPPRVLSATTPTQKPPPPPPSPYLIIIYRK